MKLNDEISKVVLFEVAISTGIGFRRLLITLEKRDKWQVFGYLYKWSTEQEWWSDFYWQHLHVMNESYGRQFDPDSIDPTEFINRLYKFLTDEPKQIGL